MATSALRHTHTHSRVKNKDRTVGYITDLKISHTHILVHLNYMFVHEFITSNSKQHILCSLQRNTQLFGLSCFVLIGNYSIQLFPLSLK